MRKIFVSGKLALAVFIFYLYIVPTIAQKGMPAKDIATASVTTNFAQHEDFKESMISRLAVPTGFKVEIAASGLGKPRMLALAENGSLYVTRRDQGDVLLLKDK